MPNAATIEAAREAKAKLTSLLSGRDEVRGIGIARHAGGFAVKVNLSAAPAGKPVPRRVAGVPVVVEIVGRISKRAAGRH